MESVETKIEKHDIEITYIKESLKDLVNYSKETAKQLQMISKAISKQEVIIEKVTNIETIHRESVSRLHDRVDHVEEAIDSEKDGIVAKLDKLERECDKIREMASKPKTCNSHNVIETELGYIKKQLASHAKIFWTVTSGVMMTIIYSILHSHLK